MRITHCDGPECEQTVPGHGYSSRNWLYVEADEDEDHGQFCSWFCLAAWATSRAMDREALR